MCKRTISPSVPCVFALAVMLAGACNNNNPAATDMNPPPSGDGGSPPACGSPGMDITGAVLQHHRRATRDGLYVAANLTRTAAKSLHRDMTFNATMSGPTYAQPLFLPGTNGGKDLLIVATEQNQVSAFDANGGAVVWQRTLGGPDPKSDQPCGNITPLGVTGTPVIDPATRTLFLDAVISPDMGTTRRHTLFALAADTGNVLTGWPVDVQAKVSGFDTSIQNQRGALLFLCDTLYVPYGGHYGDCGAYHGWVMGVPRANPQAVRTWSTRAKGGGAWAPGGVASDGSWVYAATGNTFGASQWSDGDAILRLGVGPTFSQAPADYFTPADWKNLDDTDTDLGGSGPVLVDVAGAKPGKLVVALGKDGNAYLIDRTALGGIGGAVSSAHVSSTEIINAAAAYTTAQGTYVAFRGAGAGCPAGQSGDLVAIRITAASPPQVKVAWCAQQNGMGSPMVTSTDGTAEAIVWSVGAESDNRLRGFDGDTGQVIFGGGGAPEAMTSVRRFQTPIVAGGRIFVAADARLYAFATP